MLVLNKNKAKIKQCTSNVLKYVGAQYSTKTKQRSSNAQVMYIFKFKYVGAQYSTKTKAKIKQGTQAMKMELKQKSSKTRK